MSGCRESNPGRMTPSHAYCHYTTARLNTLISYDIIYYMTFIAPEQLLLNEIQVLLAEKRTYFALLRTGLAVALAPLSFLVFLIATANWHNLFRSISIGSTTIIILILVSTIGVYIFYTSDRKIKKLNAMIDSIKSQNKRLAEIVI